MKTPPAAKAALQKFREEAHPAHEQAAHQFVEAIKTIANKPENLENLELYLSHHFPEWLEKFANTPETLTAELKEFAEMEV